ncbi:MAG: hypothetical protein M1834_009675 [Cirrosporium novae-zelandiae]|nr:MAG: hypothetical protein M1834_009675 [Cirrosporium novae-zelandiae]
MASFTTEDTTDPFLPWKDAKYPIKPGASLLEEDLGYIGVKCTWFSQLSTEFRTDNHKPKEILDSSRSTITPSTTSEGLILSTTNKDSPSGDFKYTGQETEGTSLILIFNEEEQVFYLEKVRTELNFDLSTSSSNSTAKSLAKKYSKLNVSADQPSSSEDDLFSDHEEGDADPENPWDYRHFLKKTNKVDSGSSRSPESISPADSPPLAAQQLSPKPHSQTNLKVPEPKPTFTNHHTDTDNEASGYDDEDDDDEDDGLVIEGLEDTKPKPRNRFGFPNISRPNSAGPISLRSALSSKEATPMMEESESEESDEDEDVEELHLPSPAAQPNYNDEKDDLEAQLEQALGSAQEDEYILPHQTLDDSSSESEEE